MATLEEIKDEIGKLRDEQGKHGNRLTEVETLIRPISGQLNRIDERLASIEKSHSEHKGMVLGVRWIVGLCFIVLTACGGIAGAVVSHWLK